MEAPARPLRWLLLPPALLYAGLMRLRNAYYGRGLGARAGQPVISVGNITVGGTGKTPLVMELVRRLRQLGEKPAILTRGYGAARHQQADEVIEYTLALPGTPVVVNADRVAGAALAERSYGATCLVLDDGFQHRRLQRDLDIVLIDALNPWGGGAVLPAGRLREPLDGLRRAQLIIITRANQADAAALTAVRQRLARLAPGVPVIVAQVQPRRAVLLAGAEQAPEALRGCRALAVSGLGNPATFVALLGELGVNVVARRDFPDHRAYTTADTEAIAVAARAADAELVITTRKDWVKLAPLWVGLPEEGRAELVRLDVGTTFGEGEATLTALLAEAVRR